jgi:DNA-binding CsgD family transcriptional regulator
VPGDEIAYSMEVSAVDLSVEELLVRVHALRANDGSWKVLAQEAGSLIESASIDDSAAMAICGLALAFAEGDGRRDAREVAESALAHARGRGESATRVVALRALGECARNDGKLREAIEHFRSRRSLATNDVDTYADEVYLLQLVDDFESSDTLIAEARSIVKRDRLPWLRTQRLAVAEMCHDYFSGNFERAQRNGNVIIARAEAEQVDHLAFEARVVLGRIAHVNGDIPKARALLSAARGSALRNDDWSTLLTLTQASLAQGIEDDRSALERYRAVAKATTDVAMLRSWLPNWLVDGTRTALRAGDVALAREIVSIAQVIARGTPNATTIHGVAAQTQAILDGDVDGMRAAVDALSSSPRPFVRAEAAVDYGQALLLRGTNEEAIASLEAAAATFGAIGAHGEARRVQRMLVGAGVRRRRWPYGQRPSEGWGSLTDAEQRVARLLASGLTNREAAEKLGSSPNTVNAQARAIFSKLGIGSRLDLRRFIG